MSYIGAVGYYALCLLTCALPAAMADPTNDTYCDQVTVLDTKWHKTLEGVYKLMPPDGYECGGKTVYRKTDVFGEHFIYYIDGGWSGWMIGQLYCINKGFVSVWSSADYPEYVNTTWEEFDSFRWQYNEDLIVLCSKDVIFHPAKTKMPKTTNISTTASTPTKTQTTVPNVNRTLTTLRPVQGTTRLQEVRGPEVPRDQATDHHLIMLLYVMVPVGCFVVLLMTIVVLLLYLKKQPMLDPEKFRTPSVHFKNFQNNQLEVVDDLEDVTRDPSLFGDSPANAEPRVRGDGVYDFLEQCTTGSTGGAVGATSISPPEYSQIDNKFGSWKGMKRLQ